MENNKRRPASQGPRDSSVARESRQLIGRWEYHRRLPTIARNRVREINETRSEEDTRLEVAERSRECARFAEDYTAWESGRGAAYSRYGVTFTFDNFLSPWFSSSYFVTYVRETLNNPLT